MQELEWKENGTGYLMEYGPWRCNISYSSPGPLVTVKLYLDGKLHMTGFGDTVEACKTMIRKEIKNHEG